MMRTELKEKEGAAKVGDRSRGCRMRVVLLSILVVSMTGQPAALAGEACYEHHFLGDHPAEENPGWHQEAQGLAHDSDYWYVSQNVGACVLPPGHPFCVVPNSPEGCVVPAALCTLLGVFDGCETRRQGLLWRIHVGHDLSDDVSGGSIATTSEELCNLGYNHVGDPVYYAHKGSGFVLVPIENGDPGHAVAVFKGDETLALIDYAPLLDDQGDPAQEQAAWCAVDLDGFLYSSSETATEVFRYMVDWDRLRDHDELVVTFAGRVPLLDEAGQPLTLRLMNGGEFADDTRLPFPLLYLVNGNADDDCDCGVHVFEVKPSNPGQGCGSGTVSCLLARRVDRSANGSGPFNYEYNPGFSTYEEPEGVTFWDLDADARAPGISGQVHVMMLDNDSAVVGQGDDDVYVKHYRLETDSVPPIITCPRDATAECTGDCGIEAADPQLTDFFGGVSATDQCDEDVAISNDAPSFFPLGSTPVTFTAVDDFKNMSSCTATVTVQDTIDPEISVVLDRDVLWPPNHKLVDIAATVNVTDVCDPNATFVLTSISTNEPGDGSGDGDTADDIQGDEPGTADTSFQLRSERSGLGSGRVYTIVYTGSDKSGNTVQATAHVTVPHDQSGHANGGAGFNAPGTGFAAAAQSFDLAVVSTPEFDASRIDPKTAQVGNTVGVIEALAGGTADVNRDGMTDVILVYSVPAALRLLGMSGDDNPLAFRYGTVDRTYYLVPDIFRLGYRLSTRR